MQVRARCQNCGTVFPSQFARNIPPQFFQSGAFVGNAERCIACGGYAEIESVVQGVNRGWELARAAAVGLADASPERIDFVREIARQVASGVLDAQVAERRIGEVDNHLGGLVKFAKEWGLLGAFIGLLSFCHDVKTAAQDGKIEDLEGQFQGFMRQYEEVLRDHTPSDPGDAPPPQLVPRDDRRDV